VNEVVYDKSFIAERITSLRMKKGVSSRDMSLTIGLSESQMNKIESRKSYPSMDTFFGICEFFTITPQEFFDVDSKNPALLSELLAELKELDDDALLHMLGIVRRMDKRKK
jgi:transcriptional regulator with XRE-family HTH domain